MKKILILGASILQLPAIKKAKEMGLYVCVADYNPNAVGVSFADEYYNVSTIDKEAIYNIAKKNKVDGIVTLATDMPMRSLAYACEKLGLVGINEDTAIKTTDKGEMIKAFEINNVAHPWYVIINSINELEKAKGKLTYPCIIKPTDNSGSRGVMVINDESEIYECFEYSSQNGRNGAVIIEEMLVGKEVSVEVIVYDSIPHVIQITDKITTGAPHFVELGHTQPSQLSEKEIEKIKDLAIKAVKAVGINFGAAHVEIMSTEKGPKMIELGARLGGDCISTHLVPLSTGVDMVKSIIEISLGEKPDIEIKYNNFSAIRFITTTNGKIKKITGINDALNVENIKYIEFIKNIGDRIDGVKSSVDRIGYVIGQSSSVDKLLLNIESAISKIDISLEEEKKILFLGGFPQMCDVVKVAKKNGYYSIVVDRDFNSPAKKYADKYYDISTDDIDSLIEICEKEQVSGVFNGFEDFNIHIALKLTKKLNLPFYATQEQINIVTNKKNFKEMCKNYNFDVIEQYSLDDALNLSNYPYIVKPVDSYGSRGITISYSREELIKGYNVAKSNSSTAGVVIEKYLDTNFETELFYTVINGKFYLTATADRHTIKLGGNSVPLPICEMFPSKFDELIKNELDSKFQKLFRNLKIQNGLILVQTLQNNKKFFPYEMAYRFTGEQHYQIIRKINNIDLSEMMLKYCVGEKINEYEQKLNENTLFEKCAVNYSLILKPGKIEKIEGIDILDQLPEIVGYIMVHKEGDIIEKKADYSRIFLRINMVADNEISIQQLIARILISIKVVSNNGENMIVNNIKI